MESCSQVGQDLFVIETLKQENGAFLEIGSRDYKIGNNTFLLETKFNWKGIMVEYNSFFAANYKLYRPNSIHLIQDARQINYRQILDNNNFPTNMGYLSLDLDVDNRSTLDVLELLDATVFEKYKFATVTFEHDIYHGNYFNTREKSRQIFANRGYKLVYPDIKVCSKTMNNKCENCCEGLAFEDWYIHPDIVN